MRTDVIHNADCLIGMRELPDNSIDAIIADLPYGVLNRGNKAAAWDRMIPLDLLWEQYNRIAKPGCPIILFSQGIFTARLIMSQPKKWNIISCGRKTVSADISMPRGCRSGNMRT